MFYELPTEICGHKIRTDFRPILTVLCAFEDTELTKQDKMYIMLYGLFGEENLTDIEVNEELINECIAFIDGNTTENEQGKAEKPHKRLYSWEQDGKYIISAIDKVLGYGCRSCKYLHWWEFLSAFYEIGECTFSNIVYLRGKKQRNEKLEKWEQKAWNENKDLYVLKIKDNTDIEFEMLVEKFMQGK